MFGRGHELPGPEGVPYLYIPARTPETKDLLVIGSLTRYGGLASGRTSTKLMPSHAKRGLRPAPVAPHGSAAYARVQSEHHAGSRFPALPLHSVQRPILDAPLQFPSLTRSVLRTKRSQQRP